MTSTASESVSTSEKMQSTGGLHLPEGHVVHSWYGALWWFGSPSSGLTFLVLSAFFWCLASWLHFPDSKFLDRFIALGLHELPSLIGLHFALYHSFFFILDLGSIAPGFEGPSHRFRFFHIDPFQLIRPIILLGSFDLIDFTNCLWGHHHFCLSFDVWVDQGLLPPVFVR